MALNAGPALLVDSKPRHYQVMTQFDTYCGYTVIMLGRSSTPAQLRRMLWMTSLKLSHHPPPDDYISITVRLKMLNWSFEVKGPQG